MPENTVPDTSRISITAHYTGYVWYKSGLSHPALATWSGKIGYRALQPWMAFGKRFLHLTDLPTVLLQRHLILDHLLETAIQERGVGQIVELACGLSPRGLRFMQKHAASGLRYIETDLPRMAQHKQRLLERHHLLTDQHQILACNILAPDGLRQLAQDHLNPNLPTAILTEGLVNYFDRKTMESFWQRVAAFLRHFPQGVYLSDNFPALPHHPHFKYLQWFQQLLEAVGRGQVYPHFHTEEETRHTFTKLGFQDVRIHVPAAYSSQLPIPPSASADIIQVLEARI